MIVAADAVVDTASVDLAASVTAAVASVVAAAASLVVVAACVAVAVASVTAAVASAVAVVLAAAASEVADCRIVQQTSETPPEMQSASLLLPALEPQEVVAWAEQEPRRTHQLTSIRLRARMQVQVLLQERQSQA